MWLSFMIIEKSENTGNTEKKTRIIVMSGILLCAVLMTFWFHGVLESDTVFTHLFYIPIIMASIWWQRKGLLVALFLAAILIISHIENKLFVVAYNDYLRAAGFILIAVVVAGLSEKISRSEAALRKSEEKYRTLFENAQVGIVRTTIEDGRVLEANRREAEIVGYDSTEHLKGQFIFSKQYADKGEREAMLSEILRTGKIDNFETRLIRKDGEIIWLRYSARAYPEKGHIEGIMADITAEKAAMDALLESEKALRNKNLELLLEGRKRRYLSEKLINLLERDRKRISMDLHDQVGQDLTTLKMDLEMLLSKLGPNEKAWGGKINAMRNKAVKAIRDIKEISSGLRPSVLDHLGLVPALKELCDTMNEQADVHIDFFCPSKTCDLDSAIEVAIYRIVQEGLTNMVKHSRARKGFVTLIRKGEMITLSVEDDGIGFPKQDNDKSNTFGKGMGLLIMEERAVHLGGSFHVDSSEGGGTTLLAEIPIKRDAPLGREVGYSGQKESFYPRRSPGGH